MTKMERKVLKNYNLPDDAKVKLISTGNSLRIQYLQHEAYQSPILKLNQNEYINRPKDGLIFESNGVYTDKNGEVLSVHQFTHSSNRAESLSTLSRTFSNMRDLINSNWFGKSDNELFVTLTYRENMSDLKRGYMDFMKFIMRLKYNTHVSSKQLKYMCVVEYQERGAIHFHVLLKYMDRSHMFIKSDDLERWWGFGFVKIKRITGVDNVGAYLTAYLTDVIAPDDTEDEMTDHKIFVEDGEEVEKRFIKGGRLKYYPTGANIYRCSRNLTKPTVEKMTKKRALRQLRDSVKTYEKAIKLTDKSTGFEQIIVKEFYKHENSDYNNNYNTNFKKNEANEYD